jgi:hypothetical protein
MDFHLELGVLSTCSSCGLHGMGNGIGRSATAASLFRQLNRVQEVPKNRDRNRLRGPLSGSDPAKRQRNGKL